MNVARHLARMKKKVLVVDADIAAPGVDVFEILDPAMADYPSYNPLRRLIYNNGEAFGVKPEFDRVAQERKEKQERQFAPVDWIDVLQKIIKAKIKSPETVRTPRGLVELLLALANKITGKSSHINLRSRYNDHELDDSSSEAPFVFSLTAKSVVEAEIRVIRAGSYDGQGVATYQQEMDRLISMLQTGKVEPEKAQHADRPSAVDEAGAQSAQDFRNRLAEQFHSEVVQQLDPDYVLIDCRPGADVISEFAYSDLTYTNVLCFNLNPWNLNGVIKVFEGLKAARSFPIGREQY